MRMTKWQKELVDNYENLTGLEVLNREEIHDKESFWRIWDANMRWFNDMVADVQNLDGSYSKYRPDTATEPEGQVQP